MKVVQVNCVYGTGSTGKIVEDIHRMLLGRGERSLVVYGRGGKSREAGVVKLCPEWYARGNNLLSRISGVMYGGCLLSTWKLCRMLQREAPDVVHLHCLNGFFINNYHLLAWLKKKKIKTVLTLHAEFPFTANCAHAMECEKWRTGCENCPRWRQETGSWFFDGTARSFRKMKAACEGFRDHLTVVSVSPWLYGRASASGVLGEMRHRVIENGIDTDLFFPGARGQEGRKRILHVTAQFSDDPHHPKGGWYLLELAKRMKDVEFLVAGSCCIRGTVPENMTLLGNVENREALAALYGQADLTVLTSRRETFSMVYGESLCCGTPVVGFQAGGPESLGIAGVGDFVPFGDLTALEGAVRRWLKASLSREDVAAPGAARLSKERMLDGYWDLYGELTGEAAD